MSQSDRLAIAIESQAVILPDQGPILVLRATPSDALDLMDRSRLLCEQGFRPVHDALADRGYDVTPHATAPAAAVVVMLTRARAENLGNIARGLRALPPGGLLVVNGAKTEGVDSLAKLVAAELPLDGQETKAHGRVFWLRRGDTLPEAVARWADADTLRANADGFFTAPGMFSPDGIDPGSRRLAETFTGRLKGRVADLGGGWGWLTAQALSRAPGITQIDLFEAEFRALEAARRNLDDPRVAFNWTDVTTLRKTVTPYDAVICNPPFHQGRAADPTLGASFIAAAARILKPSGHMLLVANRQLPYEAALDAGFREIRKLGEDGGYKLLLAERPHRDGVPHAAAKRRA